MLGKKVSICFFYFFTDDEMKKKWKNLRKSYSKQLRSEELQSEQEAEIQLTWPWANQMEFLRPFLQLSKTVCNIASQDVTNTNKEVEKDKEKEEVDGIQQSHQQQCDENPATVQLLKPTATRKRKSKSEQTSSHSILGQQVIRYIDKRQSSSNSAYDDIELIFMGYAKTIKKFSPRRQSVAKFKFSQILMEEELAHQMENDQNDNGRRTASKFSRPSSPAYPMSSSFVNDQPGTSILVNSSTSIHEEFGSSSLDSNYEDVYLNFSRLE